LLFVLLENGGCASNVCSALQEKGQGSVGPDAAEPGGAEHKIYIVVATNC